MRNAITISEEDKKSLNLHLRGGALTPTDSRERETKVFTTIYQKIHKN